MPPELSGARGGVERIGMRAIGYRVITAIALWAAPAFGTPQATLERCQQTVRRQATRFVAVRIKIVERCLGAIAHQVIGENAAPAGAAPACARTLERLVNRADRGASLEAQLRKKIAAL